MPQEWLFSVLAAFATDRNLFVAFAVAVSLLPVWILLSIYLRSRGKAAPDAIGIVCFLCGIALLESFGIRAQVVGWAAFAAFLYFLDRDDVWYYLAFPTAILWANLHASVALAPVIVGARVLAAALGGPGSLRGSRDLKMLPLVVLAMFCTPLGWRMPDLALTLATSPIRHYIVEWQHPGLHSFSFILGALPLAIAILLAGKRTLWENRLTAFPALALFAGALFASRNVPLFAIAAAPLAAIGLTSRFGQMTRLGARVRELEIVGLASILVVMPLCGFTIVRSFHDAPSQLPVSVIGSLAQDQSAHRLFCEDFSWCSIALQYQNVRVFIDGRCDGYPLRVWRSYIATIGIKPSWKRSLSDFGVDSVVANRGSALAKALSRVDGWKLASVDARYSLFRRE
ncbi:MAG TPA: hypothetical protein VHX17_14400 [Candidatus Cybelea sp.]|nr:hypothetical protein [Candidatus Cybelea sp.]